MTIKRSSDPIYMLESACAPDAVLRALPEKSTTISASAKVRMLSDTSSRVLVEKASRLARSNAAILLTGETGTGKELFARYIHEHSGRKGPFVAVNCGAFSDALADAELFGYDKGAYTGAERGQIGWFEAAQGGTLLLDEIGDLPPQLQVKLLRVLQERELTRVGSRAPIRIDVRLIAATNVDLTSAITAKEFRADLYFRLSVACIALPPLRERTADIETLAQHFLGYYLQDHSGRNLALSSDSLASLRRYSWPGNIRELENVIHNAVLLAPGPLIESHHLALPAGNPVDEGSGDADEKLKSLFDSCIRTATPDLFNQVTRVLVQAAFDAADGNQVRAAEFLGISRHMLRTQLSYLGVIPRRRRIGAKPDSSRAVGIETDPHELRIGYQDYGTLSILKSQQALEPGLSRRGVRVTWTKFASGPQILDALQAEEIDFGATGEVPPIVAQANGASLVYVGHEPPAPCGEALVVPPDSRIREVAQLRGKRIALCKGSNAHYFLDQCLEAHGLSLDDIDPVYLTPADMGAPLKAADGWVAWDPFLTAAQRTAKVRVLRDGSGLVYNHQFHVARADFALRHPQTIRFLIDRLRKTGRFAATNPAKAAHLASSEVGIDASSLEVAYARLTHGAQPLNIAVIREQQKIADRFFALGLIPRAISVRDAVWSPSMS